MVRSFAPYALVIVAALLMAGCDEIFEGGDSQRFKEPFHASHPVKPGVRISVDNSNGGVEIFGWEKDIVEINATKYASTEELLDSIKIEVSATDGSVAVRTVPPFGRRGNWGARYSIRVPQKAALDRIVSSNGSIRLEAVEGPARVETSNGGVRVYRLIGPLDIRTSNGGVEVTDSKGRLTARTSNGRIQATDVRGSIEAVTSNGSITARLRDPEPQQTVRLQSSNGSVDLTLDALNQNNVRISTSNSGITLRLPATANANLRARTNHSSISSDFDVSTGPGRVSKSEIEGKIGSGGPILDLETSNGSIKVVKL